MDPISVLGAITHFIEAAKYINDLLKEYKHASKAIQGANLKNGFLKRTTEDLSGLTEKLKHSSPVLDPELEQLCKDCSLDANELLEALKKLEVIGRNSKWKSIRHGLRTVWSKEKIQEMERRMACYPDAINLRVLVNFRFVPLPQCSSSRDHD